MDIRKAMEDRVLFFDGAMGTMVQQAGLEGGQQPEIYNMIHPEIITSIHKAYIEAGADIITTNTLGANKYKLEGTGYRVEEIIGQAVALARQAAGDRWVALDIGPIGQLMEPNGSLSFDDVYEAVARQVKAGVKAGADLVIIETISDLYEMKAAVLAVKENSSLPVFCTLTYDQSGRTMMGTDPLTAVNVLEGLGVDAIGANCSLGPKELLPIVDEILKYAHIPVIVQPNAGLPRLEDGVTVFDVSPEEFASYGRKMVDKGVRIIGGCCGTRPEFIEKLREEIEDLVYNPQLSNDRRLTAVSSASNTIIIGEDIRLVGERINPSGKESMERALKEEDFDGIISEAIEQKMAGAHILDINVGLPDIDQKDIMTKLVSEIQGMVNTPLQIDSTVPEVIEAAVRIYNGKPIINSVTGEEESMKAIFPIAKKYGACVIGLTIDETGIPETAQGRLEIARRIVETALKYGIPKENLLIDTLVLAASASQDMTMETLKALELIKTELKVKTILGISNVSFGLPKRSLLNRAFLAMALSRGLDAAILDPFDKSMMETIDSYRVMADLDEYAMDYINKYR
ncbi:MAG: dihydropteroate synthase [Clostridiales bacterium]|nr:dihydropteroate synthase [Clostridiales bacterium]